MRAYGRAYRTGEGMGVDGPGQLRKVAEGREAEMFAWEGGTILRLLRNPDAHLQVAWEAAAMKAAAACGVRVPAVHGTATVMDRPGLIMERIAGSDLLSAMGRRPWGLVAAARLMGRLHAELHTAVAPEGLPDLRARISERVRTHGHLPEHLERFVLEVLEGLPDGDRVCHGDFHVGNIMMEGQDPVVIDWTLAARGEPTADVARTWLMHRIGELPPGTPALVYVLALVGRRTVPALYLGAYRRERALDMDLFRRWRIVRAADRLADDIPGERPGLLRRLEREARRVDGGSGRN